MPSRAELEDVTGSAKENWYANAEQEKALAEAGPAEEAELFDGTVLERAKLWAVPKYSEEDLGRSVVDETTFATLFPKYLETYLQTIWPDVELVLKKYKCKGELNLTEGSMTVSTTKGSWDPYAIINARDFMKLLSRSVPLQQAAKIFEDDVYMDVVNIGGFVLNKERFVKRRQRLLGPDGKTLKALELLTDCYILVQGKSVAVMGNYRNIKAVKKITEDCMRNIHPIYGLKKLLIQRELTASQALKVQSWSKYLPEFRKSHLPRAKRKKLRREIKLRKAKVRTPFPPPQQPRREDIEMQTGEFWLKRRVHPSYFRNHKPEAGETEAPAPPKEKKSKKREREAEA